MSKTKIEWADETWNPVIGCSKISEGCTNCYAEKMAGRLANMGTKGYTEVVGVNGQGNFSRGWNSKTALVESALKKKFTGKGKRIFVCSMGDIWHKTVKGAWRAKLEKTIISHPQHNFLLLTKRPENISIDYLPDNVWLGVTGENQKCYEKRWDILTNATQNFPKKPILFLSAEPMLGPIELEDPFPDWVICGGESGPNARPVHPDWVRSLRDQCKSAGVPFFFKQWGEWLPYEWGNGDYIQPHSEAKPKGKFRQHVWDYLLPDKIRPNKHSVFVGKKSAGKLLDGQQHTEVPE